MEVHRVPSGAKVNGLRVQVAEPHTVVAVLRGKDGTPVLQKTELSLPVADEQYDLGFNGALFATREIAVELNATGGMKKYSFGTDSNVDEALKSIASAASSVGAIRKDIESANTPAATPDPLDQANDELRRQIINDMLKANQAAAAAGAPLPYPTLFD